MKTIIVLAVLISTFGLCQLAFAKDLTLTRGCLKDNPLAAGVMDPQLIHIYSQLCDKKNKDNKNAYLVQAAQRLQQLGLNDRAIQIVNQLEQQNIRSPSLTDTKFLIGAKFANDALLQMRDHESRALSSDLTYPAAKFLVNDIQKSRPIAAVKSQTIASVRQEIAKTSHTAKPRQKAVLRQQSLVKAPAAVPTPTKTASHPTTANPFGSLVKTP